MPNQTVIDCKGEAERHWKENNNLLSSSLGHLRPWKIRVLDKVINEPIQGGTILVPWKDLRI